MKKNKLNIVLNVSLAAYLLVWVYYAIFNWEIFSLKINTNMGFAIAGGYPFAFFFLMGFAILLVIKYISQISQIDHERTIEDYKNRQTILGKDIEILKMKEVLFKMQTTEMGKNSVHLDDLHRKLDELSTMIQDEGKPAGEDEKTDAGK